MEALMEKGVAKKWMPGSFGTIPAGILDTNVSLSLATDLKTVQRFLMRQIKPGRQVLDVVSFSDGTISEVKAEIVGKEESKKVKKGEPEKGVSVAKPTQGCPEPRLAKAELRARQVLFAFLDADQQDDFIERNAFVSVGAATGHRYMVTSRHARDALAVTRRQLYDLDERRPFCVHDYTVPAAEEMLAIHLMLQLKEHEPYLRHLE